VVATDSGIDYESTLLNLENTPKRYAAMIPAAEFFLLSLATVDPGKWLMHFHNERHTSEGFALQTMEGLDMPNGIPALSALTG
jgi:hypothetical protein